MQPCKSNKGHILLFEKLSIFFFKNNQRLLVLYSAGVKMQSDEMAELTSQLAIPKKIVLFFFFFPGLISTTFMSSAASLKGQIAPREELGTTGVRGRRRTIVTKRRRRRRRWSRTASFSSPELLDQFSLFGLTGPLGSCSRFAIAQNLHSSNIKTHFNKMFRLLVFC